MNDELSIKENQLAAERATIKNDALIYTQKLLDGLPPDLHYHGYEHTMKKVYPAAMDLADAAGLNEDQKLAITIIALFHDVGFTDQYLKNEPIGAQAAKQFIEKHGNEYLKSQADLITAAIEFTDITQTREPKNEFEQIIRDADLVLADPDFMDWSERLRLESRTHSESPLHQFTQTPLKWYQFQLNFLEKYSHADGWYTSHAKQIYPDRVKENIEKVREKARSLEAK